MYVKNESVQEINFLASAKHRNFTYQVNDTDVEVDENGKKIVKAGSVYRNSNGVAIGLVYSDVDVTNGPQPATILVEGWVYGSRLPDEVSDDDKATMTGIKFKDDYDAQEASESSET